MKNQQKLFNFKERQNISGEQDKNNSIKENSNKISALIRKNKSSLNLLRSLKGLFNQQQSASLQKKPREQSFDKIINRFQLNKIKENIANLPINKNGSQKCTNIQTERGEQKIIKYNSSINKQLYTERMKENLSKLKDRYIILPSIKESDKQSNSFEYTQISDNYQTFQKSERQINIKEEKERLPLGFFKIGKSKYQKSFLLNN